MKNKKKIILVGNQNVGKSTLFNALTGLNQKVANYPGVTIDKKTGTYLYDNTEYTVIDLPGTYSLYPISPDENVVFDMIQEQVKNQDALIVYILDASNLERNLLFYTQLVDLGLHCIMVITKNDLAKKKNISINSKKLGELLHNISIVALKGYKTKHIKDLKEVIKNPNPPHNEKFTELKEYLGTHLTNHFFKSYKKQPYVQLCISIKEKKNTLQTNNDDDSSENALIQEHWVKEKASIPEKELSFRYKKIRQILSFCIKKSDKNSIQHFNQFDKILTHPLWGILIFFSLLGLIFQSIFTWASIPMDLIDQITVFLSESIKSLAPNNFFILLLSEGIIPGIGGVLIFVPQIAILFGFLSLLEESGYMARVVFILDRYLRPFGLNGRSIVPLASGIACAVPAIQSAKSIENWKERLITMLVIPFMSCSARLPVYTTIIALVIPREDYLLGIFNWQGVLLFILYLLGTVASFSFSWILNKIISQSEKGFLIMELPTYQTPKLKNVLFQIYNKTKPFVIEVGKIIVVFSIIIWILATYGFSDNRTVATQQLTQSQQWKEANFEERNNLQTSVNLETSYLGWLGKKISPFIAPLGYDWKIGIAIISSFVAREVFIGTLSTIYSVGVDKEKPLLVKMSLEKHPNGEKVYSLATGLSLLIFYALAMQCVSTLAIVKKETGTWKWPILQLTSLSVLAYLSSLITYQLTHYLMS